MVFVKFGYRLPNEVTSLYILYLTFHNLVNNATINYRNSKQRNILANFVQTWK